MDRDLATMIRKMIDMQLKLVAICKKINEEAYGRNLGSKAGKIAKEDNLRELRKLEDEFEKLNQEWNFLTTIP